MTGSPIGMDRIDLRGRVCLVTGGTKGIGAAISKEFLAAGCELVVTATTKGSFAEFAGKLEPDRSKRVRFLEADFSRPDSLEGLITEVKSLPRLDILVNNAGTNRISTLQELQADDYDHLQDVNLRAAILLMQAASDRMIQGGWGRIVNIASIWSIVTRSGRIAYTAAKSGLVGATRTAAVDLARYSILVNAVSPGFILTDLTARTLEKTDIEALAARVPLERFADPEEISGIVVFLASGWNTYITGQNITADGGYTIV
jgi:3-oxoacyl-[acyl-carrier protein] reductase